jgi:hypothetical protein
VDRVLGGRIDRRSIDLSGVCGSEEETGVAGEGPKEEVEEGIDGRVVACRTSGWKDGDIRAPPVTGRFLGSSVGRWEGEERVLPGRAGVHLFFSSLSSSLDLENYYCFQFFSTFSLFQFIFFHKTLLNQLKLTNFLPTRRNT